MRNELSRGRFKPRSTSCDSEINGQAGASPTSPTASLFRSVNLIHLARRLATQLQITGQFLDGQSILMLLYTLVV